MFGYGQQTPYDSTSEYNILVFIIQQMIAKVNTVKIVKVVGGNGLAFPNGRVDVMPLVNQLDGNGNATPHGVVYSLTYFRLQSGINAIRMTPQIGDIGLAVVTDRDSTSVLATQKQANPGSARKYDLADGIYIGGILNPPPTQSVSFTPTGVTINDMNGNQIQMGPTGITIVGNLIVQNNLQLGGQIEAADGTTYAGNLHIGGTVTADTDVVGGGKSLKTHTHSGVTTGGGISGPPV